VTAVLVLDLDAEPLPGEVQPTHDPLARGVRQRVGDEFGGEEEGVLAEVRRRAPRAVRKRPLCGARRRSPSGWVDTWPAVTGPTTGGGGAEPSPYAFRGPFAPSVVPVPRPASPYAARIVQLAANSAELRPHLPQPGRAAPAFTEAVTVVPLWHP
jgi:hypothetical protein